ncbi:MAG TPA: DmsC/YnfH family molybdoenzyme membrane anchor subunit [Symbiobacteriaceae bacterium]|nr:DmsC/YnfH family molybdoenzyme membrane anchor subunit [Symbiobacteriaceae bacterium]
MNREDLSLAAFTLLVQLALGAVFAAAMLPIRLAGLADPGPLVHRLLFAAAPALLAGLGLSLFHLGRPGGAARAVFNLRSSWLSREVLFTALFAGLTCTAALLHLLGFHDDNVLWLATITGLAAVFTMARLYQATIRPAWSTLYTPVSFLVTAVLLGVAAAAPLVRFALVDDGLVRMLLTDMLLTGAGALAALMVALPLYAGALSRESAASRESLSLLTGRYALVMAIRIALAAAGMGLLVSGQANLSLWALGTGAAALLAGETLGRLLFFATGVPSAVGQL